MPCILSRKPTIRGDHQWGLHSGPQPISEFPSTLALPLPHWILHLKPRLPGPWRSCGRAVVDLSWAPPLCRHLKEQPWGVCHSLLSVPASGPIQSPSTWCQPGGHHPPPGKKPDARPGALPLGEANMCSAWLPIWPLSTWPVPTLLKPPGHKKEPEGACACPWPDTLCIQSTLPVRPLVACPLETPSCPPFSLWPPQISFTSSQRPGAVGPLKLSFFRPRPGAELSRVSELFL